MSTGSNYANTSVAARPIVTLGAQRNFKTWSSIDQELAASACPPQVAKRPQSVARVRSQEDLALFPAVSSALKPAQLREALSNVCFVVGLILFAISGPLAILTFFVMLFIEF